jgi:hypothetical protein
LEEELEKQISDVKTASSTCANLKSLSAPVTASSGSMDIASLSTALPRVIERNEPSNSTEFSKHDSLSKFSFLQDQQVFIINILLILFVIIICIFVID